MPQSTFKGLKAYKEALFLTTLYLRFVVANPKAREIVEKKISSVGEFGGECFAPGEKKRKGSAWYRMMLLRYALAMHFSKDATVLDTCSGLGWGAYLLSGVAKTVVGIDLNKRAIEVARELWSSSTAQYLNGSVLELPIRDNACDVVAALESIEHFSCENGQKYLGEIYRVLKPNGVLVGSFPYLPDTEGDAARLCSESRWHLHIYTKNELYTLLSRLHYKEIGIFENRYFFSARK